MLALALALFGFGLASAKVVIEPVSGGDLEPDWNLYEEYKSYGEVLGVNAGEFAACTCYLSIYAGDKCQLLPLITLNGGIPEFCANIPGDKVSFSVQQCFEDHLDVTFFNGKDCVNAFPIKLPVPLGQCIAVPELTTLVSARIYC